MTTSNRGKIPQYLKGKLTTQYEALNVVPQKAGVKNAPGVPAFASQRQIAPEHVGLPDPSTNQFRRNNRVPMGVGQTNDSWTEGLEGEIDPNEYLENDPNQMNEYLENNPNEMREFDPNFQQPQMRPQVKPQNRQQVRKQSPSSSVEQKVLPGMYVVFFQNEKAVCNNISEMEGLIDVLLENGVPEEIIEVYYRMNIKTGTRLE